MRNKSVADVHARQRDLKPENNYGLEDSVLPPSMIKMRQFQEKRRQNNHIATLEKLEVKQSRAKRAFQRSNEQVLQEALIQKENISRMKEKIQTIIHKFRRNNESFTESEQRKISLDSEEKHSLHRINALKSQLDVWGQDQTASSAVAASLSKEQHGEE